MRPSAISALLVLLAAAPASAQAEQDRPTADSTRPMDTHPSIPLERPVIDTERASQPSPQTGAAGSTADPDTPVSSDDPIDPSVGAGPGMDPAAMSGPAAAGQEPAGPYAAGVPERAAPPRTLRAHWHVFVAFAIVWALLFGYAISVGRRFARLEDEVRRLRAPAP